jgi:hypothetical protein
MTCEALPSKGQQCQFICASPEICSNGICSDPVQQGGACPLGNECASNLQCNQQTHICEQPTLAPVGQPCGFVQNQIVQCQSGLTCAQSGNGTGTCTAPKTQGEACTVGKGECQLFLYCVAGTCQTPDYSTCK